MSEEKTSSLRDRIAERFGIDSGEVFSILKATAFKVKDGEASDAQLTALLIVADQYKLNPFTREIFAFPDKQNGIIPVVSVDGWTRIINEHPMFDGLRFEYAEQFVDLPGLKKPLHVWTECVMYRKDRAHPIIVREYAEECYREPFTGKSQYNKNETYTVEGPWQSHPRRMLRHKAQIQCARIAFGFAGIYDEDEAARMIDMGAAEEVSGAGRAPDFMPRALTDDPSPTANFTGAAVMEAEPVQATQSAAQGARRARQVDGGADFTAAPNRFDRADPAAAKAQPARKTTAARSTKPAPEEAGAPAGAPQATMFVDEPAAAADSAAASQPIPENMARILGRKMEIARKTDVDLKAKFGVTLAGVTKAMFAEVQKWATGE
jgi:phage recombination protein Bet